jgi:hypothetical protein
MKRNELDGNEHPVQHNKWVVRTIAPVCLFYCTVAMRSISHDTTQCHQRSAVQYNTSQNSTPQSKTKSGGEVCPS